ncbi:hypothetical protein [Yersinia frederiksenii]|uniref:hypothetical protein n=1 Tax=Enterobacter ludwigii TaxID=299767 RepID=UPI0005E8D794|nr:Uncharacterised protein [Yersinia frederiksenii]
MTSILAKISEAIDASRVDPDIIITETILSDNTSKLFIQSVMDANAINLWDAVYTGREEWFRIQFLDDYSDEIRPASAPAGEKNSVTIIYSNNTNSPYLFTIEGWRIFLFNDKLVSNINEIHLAFIDTGFETLNFKVIPWTKTPNQNGEILPLTTPRKQDSARALVKYYSYDFLPTENPAAWILASPLPVNNMAFEEWKIISCRELLKCLTNELFTNDFQMVTLSGKPSKKVKFGKINATNTIFKVIQTAAKWVYFEGEEIELKHTFLSNELAREWQVDVSFCEGIESRLTPALDSARLLYKAHIRTSSKETLKALGDLRKNLADDMQKIVQQSKELTSSLWKDVALVISTIVIKYSLDAVKPSSSEKTYAVLFFAIGCYILISHFMTITINSNFIKTIEENRMSWRKKLYGYLDDEDYNELATNPVNKAHDNYKCVRNISTTFVIILALILFALASSEFINIKELIQQSYHSISLRLNSIIDTANKYWLMIK